MFYISYLIIEGVVLYSYLIIVGVTPCYAGLSGYSTVLRTMPASTGRRNGAGAPGTLVDNWNKCVKNLTVSSRERQASRLYDKSLAGCWQSSGRQGNVSVAKCS